MLVAGLLAVLTGTASAAYLNPVEFSATGSDPGQIGMPGRAAVEHSTGNLFAVDTANDRIVVFEPGPDGATEYLTEFGSAQLSEPWGIAIAAEGGETHVYVADAGNDRIVKYESDEAATPSFSVDAGFTSPALGTGTGQVGDFKAALAVDPTNGDLLVADPGRNRVIRLEEDGTAVAGGEFDGSAGTGSPGAFTGLTDIAVNSTGDVYVIDATGDVIFQEGTAQALRYSAAGSYKATLTPVGENQRPGTVTVRPDTDEVIVSGEQDAAYRWTNSTIHLFDSANQPQQTLQLTPTWLKSVFGLAVSSASESRLYVLTFGVAPKDGPTSPGGSYQAFGEYQPPVVSLASPTVTNTVDAEFAGSVDPEGLEGSYSFELKPVGSTADWLVVGSGSVEGEDPVAVTAAAAELDADTEYTVRLVATSPAGERIATQSFSTGVGPPVVRALSGSARTQTSVRLNALIRANGVPTQYYVEWGTTTSYGNRIPATGTLPAGDGAKPLVFSQQLTGLSAGQTIHYRYVAQSAEGTATGEDRAVETLAQPLGFEMISPPDKNGNGITNSTGSTLNEDGDVAAFWATGAFAGSEGNLPGNVYRARRGSDNWHTEGLQPPDKMEAGLGVFNAKKTSADLTKTVQASHLALAPGAVAGESNLYLRDNRTGERELMASHPDRSAFIGQSVVWGGSRDFSRVLIASDYYALTEEAEAGGVAESTLYVYDAEKNELELISTLPDGTPTKGSIDSSTQRMAERAVSADGERIFWEQNPSGAIYMWEDGDNTLISASHRPGDDPETPMQARFVGASTDGSYVFITSAFPLTADAAEGVENLYRYDVERDELKNLTPGTGESEFTMGYIRRTAVSQDGSRVYFLAPQNRMLNSEAVPGKSNLYLWEAGPTPADPGEYEQIAAVGKEAIVSGPKLEVLAVSPSGSHLAFTSKETALAGRSTISPNCRYQWDAIGYCSHVYVYDAATDEVGCASCTPVGAPSGYSEIGGRMRVDEGGMLSRPVLDDGSVFFDTPNQLVPEDVNNRIDVYRWRDGQIDLISSGLSAFPSYFGDATPDGSTVSFFTSEQLVKQDQDDVRDLYAVRVNGGLPAQNTVPPEPVPCVGEACRGGGGGAPSDLSPATPRFSGPGNVKSGPVKKRCGKGKQLKKVKGKQRCVKRKAKSTQKGTKRR